MKAKPLTLLMVTITIVMFALTVLLKLIYSMGANS